jgi:pyruvate-ferredoxin/flavodoxin oxidoreductase
VGANKNTIKVIGENTPFYVQAYFQYDSKKSGGVTISHLRFGKQPIHSAYLIDKADFLACHNPSYLQRFTMLDEIKENGVFLCNCPWTTLDELNTHLPPSFKQKLAKKKIKFFVIDGTKIANETGLSGRTSSVMQAAFFLLNPTLIAYDKAKELLKADLAKRFAKKGQEVIDKNCKAIDATENAIREIHYPDEWAKTGEGANGISYAQDEYFQTFMLPILNLQGDTLPVSAFSPDGSVPTGTAKLEKHGVPYLLPVWIEKNCIQCNQCSFVCPHACIRPFLIPNEETPPVSFTTLNAVGVQGAQFRIQVSPHDCMGCGVCADVCPTKEKALVMRPSTESMTNQDKNWEYGVHAPTIKASLPRNSIKGSQFYPPLFEFSYACSGCGETSYIKVLTQLFGERMLIANATGCSSIYGGSAPSCPYTKNEDGFGPAWANSLFEDNAEFGYGMQLAQQALNEKNSVWIIGGDGWAYDIGYGGLDHVLASGENVNVLVLDSEVYSNTGGQCSKATPRGATARFAAKGKTSKKKDLALMAMCYQTVYVAQVSIGANKQQFLNALTEAEAYDGPSLIIAYSPCIEHGMPMSQCMQEEKNAVDSGYWQLFRFHPDKLKTGQSPLILDSGAPKMALEDFYKRQNRFRNMHAEDLYSAKKESEQKLAFLRHLIDFYNSEKN